MYRLAILACIVVAAHGHMLGMSNNDMNMQNMAWNNNMNMNNNMNNNNNNQAMMQMMMNMMMNNGMGGNMDGGYNGRGNQQGQNSVMNMLVTTLMGQLFNNNNNNNNNNQGYSSNDMRQMERMMQQKMMMEMAEMMMHYMDFQEKQKEFEKAMMYLCIGVNATYYQSERSGKGLFNRTTDESADAMFKEAESSTPAERFMAMVDLFATDETAFGEMFLRIATWTCKSGEVYMEAYQKMEMLEKQQEKCGDDHDDKKK